MEILSLVLASGIGAGIMTIIQMILKRHWDKQDKEAEEERKKREINPELIEAIININRVQTIEFVRSHGKVFIERGEISLDDKETIQEMFDCYHALGGNGHLNTVMEEIDKLKVVS